MENILDFVGKRQNRGHDIDTYIQERKLNDHKFLFAKFNIE